MQRVAEGVEYGHLSGLLLKKTFFTSASDIKLCLINVIHTIYNVTWENYFDESLGFFWGVGEGGLLYLALKVYHYVEG